MKKILLIFILFSLLCYGKEYNIGDNISLKIKGNISREKIEKAFENFKNVKIDENKNYTIVSFRSFTLGKNSIDLGDKKIIINIKSTLDKKDTKIFKNLKDNKNKYLEKDYPYKTITFGIFSAFFLILGLVILAINRRKDAFNIFRKNIKKTTAENWSENISYSLRDYLDRVYQSNLLNGEYKKGILDDVEFKFLKELDYIKFSKNKNNNYKEYEKKAMSIVEKLRKEKRND